MHADVDSGVRGGIHMVKELSYRPAVIMLRCVYAVMLPAALLGTWLPLLMLILVVWKTHGVFHLYKKERECKAYGKVDYGQVVDVVREGYRTYSGTYRHPYWMMKVEMPDMQVLSSKELTGRPEIGQTVKVYTSDDYTYMEVIK